jgi:HK97 family phage major capsid protein
MSSLREILQRRDALRVELRGILDQHPDGALPDEVRARADELEASAGLLNDQERRQVLIDELDRRAVGTPLSGPASPGRLEVRAFDVGPSPTPEAFDGLVLRAQDGSRVPVLEHRHRLASFLPASESRAAELGVAGFLRALHSGPQSELERRVLAEAAIGSGGAFLPTPLAAEVIDLLRAHTVTFQAGARTIPMTSATLRFARITGDPVGSWRAENTPITVSDPTFDNVTLAAKSWALIVLVSRELLEDATNIDAQLRNAFAKSAALALDRAILSGPGTGNAPLGIANTPGISVVSMGPNGANFVSYGGSTEGQYASLLDAVLALDNANAGEISAMIMPPRTSRAISGFVDGLGQPLRAPARLVNVPQLVTTSMSIAETQGTSSAASSLLIGSFSEVFVGMRTALQVNVLSERYADTGQVGFCLWMRGDVQIARPAALARIEGIIP